MTAVTYKFNYNPYPGRMTGSWVHDFDKDTYRCKDCDYIIKNSELLMVHGWPQPTKNMYDEHFLVHKLACG